MDLLASYQSISKSYGAHNLFSDISINLFQEERLGLIGANGSGKSTLLKIFAQIEDTDTGSCSIKKHVRSVYLAQDDYLTDGNTLEKEIFEFVSQEDISDTKHYSQINQIIGKAGFADLSVKVGKLSGGWRKRVAITKALVQLPDLLLLDEPTNHLDLEGIVWLEEILNTLSCSFVVVSHDRYFLENTTNRIIELGRYYPGGYFKVEGKYSDFLIQRQTFLESQEQQEVVLANKMRRETEWLNRGPKARTSKAKYRIDEAYKLSEELFALKNRNANKGSVEIEFNATDRKTKKLVRAKNISKTLGNKKLFDNLDITLCPGMRIGLLGKNGTGKSTLIHILNKKLEPDTGYVDWADNLQVVLFDQKREQLDQNQILRRALSPAGDSVVYGGSSIHIVTWAKKFLFRPDHLDMPVSRLSGGEQARILIAKLMLQPADVLLLDEPTNDLDIPSLEVLEESLKEFPGVIVLITHDRYLLDRVATQVIGLNGKGNAGHFADYNQWIQYSKKSQTIKKAKKEKSINKTKEKKEKKFTYKHKYELDSIEEKILQAEESVKSWETKLNDPEVSDNPELLQDVCSKLAESQKLVDQLYDRWNELETLKNLELS